MSGNPITSGAKPGNLVYTVEEGYYGLIQSYDSRTEKFLVFLGNGLRQELSRQEFVCLPLRYGQSLHKDSALASFHEILPH